VRVLIATQHLGIVGGVETYLRAVLPRLAASGFELAVLAEHGRPTDEVLAYCPGVPVWKGDRPALAEVDRWRPDVVYAHGLGDPRFELALAERFPTVFFAHNYHGTCVSGTKCHTRPGYESCGRALGLGCLAAYFPRGCGGRNPLTMLGLYRTQRRRNRVLGSYRAVLVASRHMADEYRRHGVAEERLRLVPLFPPDATPDPDPPPARALSDRVLFVGRVTALKGLCHLVEALPLAGAKLGRRLTLVVAGDGPDRAAARIASRRLGVSAEFLGWVGPERRTSEMRSADVLAVPSLWPEPFGLIGLEAGCVGLPAVGYATGGIPDWLVPGASGESAPAARPDPKDLAGALVRALCDESHLHQLRIGAWETARRFTPEGHVRQLSDVFDAVSNGRLLVRAGGACNVEAGPG
jgi:glycosyltransferase involved in cell wall biosynthesis